MIHFKRNSGDIYDLPNSSGGSARHALIQRILFSRRRQNSEGEPFAVLGSRKPHYIHIRTSQAYAQFSGVDYDRLREYATRSHDTLSDDSASEYSCESGEAHSGDSGALQGIDFTVIWDPETGFSVYESDSDSDHSGSVKESNRQIRHENRQPNLPQTEDLQKKPLPRPPSGISLHCEGLTSQFPGETDSESFYGGSSHSGHPDCDPHLPSRFSMTTVSSFIQANGRTSSGKIHDMFHKLRQPQHQQAHHNHLCTVPLQARKREKIIYSRASIRHFSAHFPVIRRKGKDISDEHWVFVEAYPWVSDCLVSST